MTASDRSSTTSRLGYVPQLLPGDADGFAETERWRAAIVGAPQVVNPGTRRFVSTVRDHTDLLLVDPRTATYQFEGYMSMEEARAVPYSPGRTTLGTLWEPSDFADATSRRALIDSVLELQRQAGAGLPLAPYFAIPTAGHPWLEVAAATAEETLVATGGDAGVVVQVELDALLSPDSPRILETFAALRPALGLVIVTEFDELQASPREAATVLEFLEGLRDAGWPLLPAYTGRFGLVAMAVGASGLAGGALELESYPRRYLREGFINLKANAHYLPGAMVRLPVLEAERVIAEVPEAAGDGPERPARLVQRRRVRAALEAKRSEAEELMKAPAPREHLRERVLEALERCRAAAAALERKDAPLRPGRYHYLEVLGELLGGPAATVPEDAGF